MEHVRKFDTRLLELGAVVGVLSNPSCPCLGFDACLTNLQGERLRLAGALMAVQEVITAPGLTCTLVC